MKNNTPKKPHFGPFSPNSAPYCPYLAPFWGCPGHPLAPFFVAPMAIVRGSLDQDQWVRRTKTVTMDDSSPPLHDQIYLCPSQSVLTLVRSLEFPKIPFSSLYQGHSIDNTHPAAVKTGDNNTSGKWISFGNIWELYHNHYWLNIVLLISEDK